jgi:hypothetical protein
LRQRMWQRSSSSGMPSANTASFACRRQAVDTQISSSVEIGNRREKHAGSGFFRFTERERGERETTGYGPLARG